MSAPGSSPLPLSGPPGNQSVYFRHNRGSRRWPPPGWFVRLRPFLLGFLLLGLTVFVVIPLVGAYVVEQMALPKVSQRLGLELSCESAQVRLGQVTLHKFQIHDPSAPQGDHLLAAPLVTVTYKPLSLLFLRLRLRELTIEGAHIKLGNGSGTDSLARLKESLRKARKGKGPDQDQAQAPAAKDGPALYGLERIWVQGADLDLRESWGTLRIGHIDAEVVPETQAEVTLSRIAGDFGAATARAGKITVVQQLDSGNQGLAPKGLPKIAVEGGAVAPWKNLALTGIHGTLSPDEQKDDQVVLSLHGGYGGVERDLWDANGYLRPKAQEAKLRLRAARFRLSSLDPILKDTPIIESDQAQVDASLDLDYFNQVLDFDGSFNVSGLSIFTERLAPEPVRALGISVDARGKLQPQKRKYQLERATFRMGGATATLSIDAEAQPAHLRVINLPANLQGPPGAPPPTGRPGWRERWRMVTAHLTVPPIPCQTALDSIPAAIVPHLQGFRLGGTFFTDVKVSVDFAQLLRLPPPPPLMEMDDPDNEMPLPSPAAAPPPQQPPAQVLPPAQSTAQVPPSPKRSRRKSRKGTLPPLRQASGAAVTLPTADPQGDPGAAPTPIAPIHPKKDKDKGPSSVFLTGKVGIDGCKVLSAPSEMNIERLLGSFTHSVEVEPERFVRFVIGPENPEFVPFEDISPYLINSIMTTEDNGFMKHRGFIGPEFRSALEQNLQRGYFRLGASSITMQLVKNVLLSREKTLARKLQELFLTWYLEQNLTKERILEIYFNAIEFGPYLYGIGPAVQRFFGKTPKELTPRESAWFSSILPSPKKRYIHYCKGKPDLKWEAYLTRILRRVHERGRLTDEEFQASLEERFLFNREDAPTEKDCLALIKRLTEPQQPPPGAPQQSPAQ